MSRRVVVALVVASTRRAHVRNARAPRRRPPPRSSRDLLSSPRSRSDGRRASRRVRRRPRRGLPGRPGAPRDRAPRRAHGENREARRGKDRSSEGSARVRGFARGRVRGGDPRDAPARRRYVRKRPRAAPSAPPPFAPRSFAPPIRPVASRRFLSPMDRSNLTRSSAILSDHPTRGLSPPSASTVTHPPRPPHPLRHHQTTRVSPPSPRAPASSPASSPPTRPLGTPSSSPTTTADASRASTGATRRSAAPRSTASGRTNRR